MVLWAASPEKPDIVRMMTPADYQKVIASPGLLDEKQPGITLWHDYGAFALYKIAPKTLETISPNIRAQLTLLRDSDRLLVNAYPFDTQKDGFDRIPANCRTTVVSGTALHLIQFVGPIKDRWLKEVTAAGAKLVHYVPHYGYLVWADAAACANLDAMAQTGDFLQFRAPYQTYFKIGNSLYQKILANKGETVDLVVQIYAHPDAQKAKNFVKSLLVAQQSDWTNVLSYQNIHGKARVSDVATIAALPEVVWVGERIPRELHDEVQDQILAGNLDAAQSGPSGAGYLAWLTGLGFSTDPADYPIVDITDDGIGNGTVNSGDNTLHQSGDDANPTRLAYVSNCTADPLGDGVAGHGHINTSIVGGYDARSGFPFQDSSGYLRGTGVSPYGRLAGTKIFTNAGTYDISGCGGTDTGLIKHVQDLGAAINSNSWGANAAGAYDDSAQAYDAGVRDADLTEAGNQPLIVFFSAGNAGSGASTIGSPGTAKNVITVGASENDRPSDEDGTWTDGCAIGPTGADNAMDIISFSSRGPAAGNRVKPEIVGPGTHIQGTASTNASYTGDGVCDQYRPSGQTEFAASSGTSHSTPALAGVGSLYYHWLQNTYSLTPSPAMMKAYIIAHPHYLTGVSANDTLPSNNQGYGMPDMGAAFDATGRYLLDQTHVFPDTGQTWNYFGMIENSSKPVRVVLTFTDAPGVLGAAPQINDLNLEVTVGGQTYLGNVFSGQWSATGGAADANNNYEAVFLPAGTSGFMQITVTAANIAGDGIPNNGDATDQDFALAVYNVSEADLGQLEGSVTETGTGTPLQDARVVVTDGTSLINFRTNDSGYYGGDVPVGTYGITVTQYGYNTQNATGVSIIADATTTQDFAMTSADYYQLSGSVTDANTGWPLYASVEVTPDGFTSRTIWTNPWTGEYSISIPGTLSYALNVQPWEGVPGYLPETRPVTLSGNTVEDFALSVGTCNAPGYTMQNGLSEDFEDAAFPPAGWAAYNIDGGGTQWALSPARVHSGTNAALHYYSTAGTQDGWLRTPQITLDSSPELRFWENINYASYYAKHSLWICTAGCDAPPANYTQVAEYDSPAEDTWVERVTDLSAYAGQSVYLAFRYEGDDADEWYIDDVEIPGNCIPPVDGGLLAGGVYDANTNDHLPGATVANSLGHTVEAKETSADNAVGDAFYAIYAPGGSQIFTAAKTGYEDGVATVISAGFGQTIAQDFFLEAPYPQAAPASLSATVMTGDSDTLQLTLSNGSAAIPFDFEIKHDTGVLVVERDANAAAAMETALTNLGYSFLGVSPLEFQAMTVNDLKTYRAVFYAGPPDQNLSTGPDHALLISYLDDGGSLYVSDNDVGYYHASSDITGFYGTYLQATYVSDDPGINNLIGQDIMTGVNPDISADPYPDDFTVNAEGARIFQFTGGNAAGVKVERNGYRAVYTSFDFDDIASAADEQAVIERVLNFLGYDPMPWLTETPATGTVPAGGQVVVDVAFDSTAVGGPGEYHGKLNVLADSPYEDITIPVTMTVVPPSTLQVSKSGDGDGTITSVPAGINCGSDCMETYPLNTLVTLTATPANYSLFANWTGDCTGTKASTQVRITAGTLLCTACFVADLDDDGMADDWETAYGVDDPDADPDGDNFTNLQEYQAGTDPTNPLSHPVRPMPWLMLLLGE